MGSTQLFSLYIPLRIPKIYSTHFLTSEYYLITFPHIPHPEIAIFHIVTYSKMSDNKQ